MIDSDKREIRLNDYTLTLAPADEAADDLSEMQVHVGGPEEVVAEMIERTLRAWLQEKEGRRLVWELMTTARPEVYEEDVAELIDKLDVPSSERE